MHTSVNCFEHIEFIEYILQVFVGQSISRAESSRDCAICGACVIVIGRFDSSDSNAKLLTKYLAIRIQKERMKIKKKLNCN